MAVLTTRMPDKVAAGFVGGPEFATDVVIVESGFEQRNQKWSQARRSWQADHRHKTQAETDALIDYFHAAAGRANTFRFKDHDDYQAASSAGRLGTGAVGTGLATYQLYKRYSSGGQNHDRKITRPVSGTLTVYRNAVAVTVGAAAGNIAINHDTGLVTFVADTTKNVNANSAKTITAITQANPGVVTATAHGFVTGDKIKITGVVGMTQVNDLYFTITVIDANSFSIGVDTTAYTAYSSGGTATKHGITQTNPARVYSTAHGFSNGQLIHVSGATGMTQVNGLAFTVANASADFFDLSGINATAYGAYTDSGLLSKFPQPGDALTWAGDFDVLARFDTDKMELAKVAPHVYSWDGIPIIEVRE